MNRFLKFIYIAIIAFIAGACSDDTPPGPQVPDSESDFEGPHRVFTLGAEADGLSASDISIVFLAENGVEFSRSAVHTRSEGKSTFCLDRGLAEGTYRLLAAGYTTGREAAGGDTGTSDEFGFGSRIRVASDGITVIDSFNPTLRYAGRGSKEDPYIVSSSTHLFNLMMSVNDYDSNREIPDGTYFMQVCDIDMKQISRNCDMEYGWMPIGADTNTPFRGVYLGNGHAIKNLMINRPNSAGIGLFGFICNATIDGLTMSSCSVAGQFAVGTVAGAIITTGGSVRSSGTVTNCTAKDCSVTGPSTSASLGGILGATDMHVRALVADCTVSGGSLSGGMNVGGITGGAGLYSSVMISGCENSATVTSLNSGAGGIIGTADTLQVVGCTNTAAITGSTSTSDDPRIGTGGIAGGTGISWITGSRNTGKVTGYEGVGGIIGSTRVCGSKSETYIYNQSVLRHCSNSGEVSGTRFVGGAIGEAQAGAYGVCNTGTVSATDYAGGICGTASVAVIHNSINGGEIKGASYVAGIIGKCTWGSFAIDQNLGAVTGTSGHTAGILALAGNNTIVNYCANFGTVKGQSSSPVGGIVGEVGDPRKWTAANVADCVVGSLECVMAFAGPVLAVAEGAIELSEAVEMTIKLIEVSAEIALQVSDYTLVSYSIDELISPEAEEELSATMHAKTQEATDEITDEIKRLRRQCTGNISNFGQATLATSYIDNIENVVGYYETEGNDEKFNEAINETREARAKALERYSKNKEIVHTVIAGVAVVTSTVALIGGSIASGGTATAFLVAGSAMAIVGGANAIIKSCTEFENNAVVISQCVNAGTVSAPGSTHASSIAGKMCDNCQLYDCLNTAEVDAQNLQVFAGDVGSRCEIFRCVSLPAAASQYINAIDKSVICDPSLPEGSINKLTRYTLASPSAMAEKSVYTSLEFSIGQGSLWNIPAGLPFPVPEKSQMQE